MRWQPGCGAPSWVRRSTGALSSAAAQEKSASANEQIQFACIGVGGKGRSDSADAARHGTIVAICDVDEQTLRAGLFPLVHLADGTNSPGRHADSVQPGQ